MIKMSIKKNIERYFKENEWNEMSEFEKQLFTEFNKTFDEFALIKEESIKDEPLEDTSQNCTENVTFEKPLKDEPIDVNASDNDELGNTLFCWNCQKKYTHFCLNCPMLVHILDNDVRSDIYSRTKRTLPKDILTVQQSTRLGNTLGIFTTLTIPAGVKFGPCEGSNFIHRSPGCGFQMKHGRFVKISKEACSNWMLYINCVTNESEGNLTMFQQDYCLYFRTSRQIKKGEELLLYQNPDYLVNFHKSGHSYYCPAKDKRIPPVFACTYCCLGFNSEIYLRDHKTVCPFITEADIEPINEIVRCPFCLIYLDEKEYSGFHMTCCSEKHTRKCVLLNQLNITPTPPVRIIERSDLKESYKSYFKNYTCFRCNYSTQFYKEYKSHICSNFQKKSSREKVKSELLLKNGQREKKVLQKSQILRRIDFNAINVGSPSEKEGGLMNVREFEDKVSPKTRMADHSNVCSIDSGSTDDSFGSITDGVRKSKRIGNGIKRTAKYVNAACCSVNVNVEPRNIVSQSDCRTYKDLVTTVLHENESQSQISKREEFGIFESPKEPQINDLHVKDVSTANNGGFCLVKVYDFSTGNVAGDLECDSLATSSFRVLNLAKYFECDHCSKKYINKDELVKHLRSCKTMNGSRLVYQCESCNFKTNHLQSIQWHKSKVHGLRRTLLSQVNKSGQDSLNSTRRKEAVFICPGCNRGFLYKKQLEKHEVLCDSATDKEKGPMNGRRIKKQSKKLIRVESTIESDKEVTLYQCRLCKELYRQYNTAKIHVQTKHELVPTDERGILKCWKCSFETPYKRNLKRHLYVHEKIKPFECTACRKKFNRRSHFDDHMMAYHNKNAFAFKCEDCDQSYCYNESLRRHQKQVHNKTEKYKFKKKRISEN